MLTNYYIYCKEQINPSIITHQATTDSISIQAPGTNTTDLLQTNNTSLITTNSASNITNSFTTDPIQLNQHIPYIIVNYIIKT